NCQRWQRLGHELYAVFSVRRVARQFHHEAKLLAMEPPMKRLNYAWRMLATGLCFATFSISGLVLSYGIIPAMHLLSRDAAVNRLRTRKLIQQCFRNFTRMMSFLGVIEFDIRDAEQQLARHRG